MCKTEEEINAKIDNLNLLVIYNNERYNSEAYGDQKIIEKYAKVERISFDRFIRPFYRQREIQLSEVDSDDFHLSSLNNWSNVYHTYSLIESDTSVRY